MYKLGSLPKVVLGALTLALSTSLWANSDSSQINKQQQIKEFKQNSVAYNPHGRARAAAAFKKRHDSVGNSTLSTSGGNTSDRRKFDAIE